MAARMVERGGRALVAAVAVAALAAGGGPARAGIRAGMELPAGQTAAAGTISTVAGGVGGPAEATKVSLPGSYGVAYARGEVYVADGTTVRDISAQTGRLTTVAGTNADGPLGARGLAAHADGLDGRAVAVDSAGNLVVADDAHQRILVIAQVAGTFYGQAMTARHIYSVAGTGTAGLSGDGGPATAARINTPVGVAVDGAGNLLIADTDNNRIRMVAEGTGTFYGQAMTAGDIYTIAGTGRAGRAGDGGPATAARINTPVGVAVDGAGNLLIADTDNNRIRVVAGSTGAFYGQVMTAGDIYTVAGGGVRGRGDGGPATAAQLDDPEGVATDSAGNLVIAERSGDDIRVAAASTGTFYGQAMTVGDIYTVSRGGADGSGTYQSPSGVTLDGAGNLVIADPFSLFSFGGGNRIWVVAASTGTFYGQAMTAGHIYPVAGTGSGHFFRNFSGDFGLVTRAELAEPGGVTADSAGNLVIADTLNYRVRVAAAATGTFYGRAMTVGHIYTVAGNGFEVYNGDGRLATFAALGEPGQVALDASGNVLITDTENNRIRVVAESTGTFYGQAMRARHIYTVAGGGFNPGDGEPATAAELVQPRGVAVDPAGNLLIADAGRVRVVAASTGTFYGQAMTAGDIYTAAMADTQAVAADGPGNLLIADAGTSRIRVVAGSTGIFYGQAMTAGGIYTIAGTGTAGYSGDGGPASEAELDRPDGVAVDGTGNLLISDTLNNRIRVVAGSSGTFYGQAMVAGDIYTVAGNGRPGFSGDGHAATAAAIEGPQQVAADGPGGLVFADPGSNRIRAVAG